MDEDDINSVEDDLLDTSSIQIDLEREAASSLRHQELKHSPSDRNTLNSTAQPAQKPRDAHQFSVESEAIHPVYVQPQAASANVDTVTSIVTAIANSFSTSRLPAREPIIFSGEPIVISRLEVVLSCPHTPKELTVKR